MVLDSLTRSITVLGISRSVNRVCRWRCIEFAPPIQIISAAIAIIQRAVIGHAVFIKTDVFQFKVSFAMQTPCAVVFRNLVFVDHRSIFL